MDGALVERLHLEFLKRVGDDATAVGGFAVFEDTVFGKHLGDDLAVCDDLELDGAGVNVWCVEAARPEETDGHTSAGADERGESLAVGSDEVATFSAFTLEGGVVEGEDELLVIWQEVEAVCCGVGEEKLLGEGRSLCWWWGRGSGAGCAPDIWWLRCCESSGCQDGGCDDGVEEHFDF